MNLKKYKKIISISILSLLGIISVNDTSYAESFSGGRKSASFKCYYDSSVANYGYRTTFDTAISRWNNTSSKVSISKTTNTSSYPDKYYIGNTSISGVLGRTIPYKKNIFGKIVEDKTNDDWTYCTVALYDNTMKENYMNSSQIHSNATHEIGHTLSQAHPDTSLSSVMKQGIQSIGPTSYDKSSITSKWGK